MNYNLTKEIITNLNEVDSENVKKYYRYKEIDFYFKKYDTSDRLLVCFHGSNWGEPKQPLPLFRGYDRKYNVLCISDKLLELYPSLNLGWYLSPKGFDLMTIYIEIINSFIIKYTNVIFNGSSGGGFPSLLFSSYFHKKAIIQNSQIYLTITWNILNRLLELLKIQKSDLNIIDGESIIEQYGLPSMVIIISNKNDTYHYDNHYLPFLKYIGNKGFNSNFTFIEFIGKEPVPPHTHHTINCPSEKSLNTFFDELFLLPIDH